MGHFGLRNHSCQFFPEELWLRVASLFFSLRLRVLEEKHADEEVKKEERAKQDENYVEVHVTPILFESRSLLCLRRVD